MTKIAYALIASFALSIQLTAQSPKVRVLHDFGSSSDGNVPSGPLLLDKLGNIYGATGGGPGEYGNGLIFELTPQPDGAWSETILHAFSAGNDGAYPWGALLQDGTGALYGTVSGYLSYAVGGVFELTPGLSGWANTILYADSAGPGILMGAEGNLFGKIGPGDYFGLGAIGELSPGSSGWTYTQLYSFTCDPSCANGYNPPAPPIWDAKGDLWGVTTFGGINGSPCFTEEGCGVIFNMTPNGDGTWTYHVMHRFAASIYDGQRPYSGLVMDSAGNFYGATWLGGAFNNGTVFKFALVDGEWKETILYDFPDCHGGCQVDGTLAMDGAGNLYGTASGGTKSCEGLSCGVVFKLEPQTTGLWKYTKLYNFNDTSGGVSPFYGVILDSEGNLYGVTSNFGKYGGGTAFEITP
jgi:hypothetical protein